MHLFTTLRRSTLGVAFTLSMSCVLAQDAWPSKSVQLLVPFPAGGLIDVVARAMAEQWQETLGKSVVVVNRDGGGGSIGVNAVATATPDGHTLGMVTSAPLTVLPLARKGIPYRLDQLRGVCKVAGVPMVLALGPHTAPANANLAAFIATAKGAPGKLNVGFVGEGTFTHLAMADFAAKAGIQITLVPYRGDPPMALALRAGEIDAAALTLGMTVAQGFTGAVLFSDQRHPDLPQTPTAVESGLPVSVEPSVAIIAPRSIAEPALRAAEKACLDAMRSPRVAAAIKAGRFQTYGMDGQALDTQLRDEVLRSEVVLRRLGLLQQ